MKYKIYLLSIYYVSRLKSDYYMSNHLQLMFKIYFFKNILKIYYKYME